MKEYFKYTLKDTLAIDDYREGKGLKIDDACNLIVNAPDRKDKLLCLKIEGIIQRCVRESSKFEDKEELKQLIKDAEELKKETKTKQKENEETGLTKEELEAQRVYIFSVFHHSTENNTLESILFYICELMTQGNRENPKSTIDGVRFTKPMFEDLSLRDTKEIIGTYIQDFLL